MGCICSTSRTPSSPGSTQFGSTHERFQSSRTDEQSSPNVNLSALAALLDATHTLNHQLDADRSVVGEVLTPLQHATHELREEIAERIHSGFWDSPPNILLDRLNSIRRDFNAIIALGEGQRLHYSGEFLAASPSSRVADRSEITVSGSLPGTP